MAKRRKCKPLTKRKRRKRKKSGHRARKRACKPLTKKKRASRRGGRKSAVSRKAPRKRKASKHRTKRKAKHGHANMTKPEKRLLARLRRHGKFKGRRGRLRLMSEHRSGITPVSHQLGA